MDVEDDSQRDEEDQILLEKSSQAVIPSNNVSRHNDWRNVVKGMDAVGRKHHKGGNQTLLFHRLQHASQLGMNAEVFVMKTKSMKTKEILPLFLVKIKNRKFTRSASYTRADSFFKNDVLSAEIL